MKLQDVARPAISKKCRPTGIEGFRAAGPGSDRSLTAVLDDREGVLHLNLHRADSALVRRRRSVRVSICRNSTGEKIAREAGDVP